MSKIYFLHRCLKMFLAIFLICFCFLANTNINAQQTISGAVKDGSSGKFLSGATVSVKGTNQNTFSNVNGAFTITVPGKKSVIIISYVGYVTQEIEAGENTNLEVSLQPNATELNQVVVVGYGTQRKRDVTGSIKSLKSDDFNKGIITSPQQLLQGKVSGVNVTSASGEPGAAMGITVRGPGGVRTGSTPLFVVDGLPLDNSSTGGGDPLNFINPQDIETIDVLKDASATAIYGARGANGVIIITTKRGKAGISTLGFSSSIGVSTIARYLPVFTGDEFRIEVPKAGGVLDNKGGNTNWQKEAVRKAITQNYNLNLSGGANKLSYFASLGMQRQEGIIKKNDLNRYSGRFNVTQRFLEDRLVLELNMNVGNTKQTRPPITSVLGDVITYNPTYPAYDANGKPAVYQNINPLLYFDLDKEITTINRVIGNISPSFRIIKGLIYKLNFGIDNSTSTRDVESLPSTIPFREGRLENIYNWNRNTLIENYLTYAWNNTKHNVSALAGHSYQKIFVQQRNSSINRFVVGGVDPIYNPGVGQDLTLANNRPGGFAFINELQSFFGRVTYQYNNKYLFTANFRADGSSKFGDNNKYGYFPSFSLGWKISDEKFMENSMFSNLKLRAGWGLTGNQEIPPKITQALFTSLGSASYPLYPASGNYPAGYAYTRLANSDIQWESSEQTDLGLDFGLFKGALTGTIDFFRKVSNNILLQVIPADPVQPATDVWSNVKDMTITNKGAEFELDYRYKAKSAHSISYNVGGNLTLIKNKVEKSPYSLIPAGSVSGAGITSSTINGYVNGQPIGTFYLKEFTGFDNNGMSTYTDVDKNGVINDNDRLALGTALPNCTYSFYGNIAYKGFDLSVNFNGVSGNKIYNYTENVSFSKLRLAKNVNATSESVADPKESLNNPTPVTSRYLRDGAYLRLNNASLGYNFNTTSLRINKWVSAVRLSVTGQNLFVSTKYKGYDPEVNIDRSINGVSSYGIDFISYPKARSFIFSLNFSF
ncbi:SusC/RagA family TonB-linked outer membrane protein [Ferruginibacter sp.]